jgi:amidase
MVGGSLTTLSATRMARLIARRELSAVELVNAHLERIEALNPTLNAFVFVDTEGARRQARAADAAVLRGDALGPLHGIPPSPGCPGRRAARFVAASRETATPRS